MNWDYIIEEVAETFLRFAVICGGYISSKEAVRTKTFENNKPTLLQYTWFTLRVILFSAIAIVAWCYKNRPTVIVIYFFIVVIPALIGLYAGLKENARLTPEQKNKIDMDREISSRYEEREY